MIHTPAFVNSFQEDVDRKLNKEELIQTLRLDVAGELEAIYLYDAHVQATDIEITEKVLTDICGEERAHIGELMTLPHVLDPQETESFAPGGAEVREMLGKLEIAVPEDKFGSGFSASATVGSPLDKS